MGDVITMRAASGRPRHRSRAEFETIAQALSAVRSNLDTDQGRRTYLAYLLALRGVQGADSQRDARIDELIRDVELRPLLHMDLDRLPLDERRRVLAAWLEEQAESYPPGSPARSQFEAALRGEGTR